jgi:hypothetical protein
MSQVLSDYLRRQAMRGENARQNVVGLTRKKNKAAALDLTATYLSEEFLAETERSKTNVRA